MEPGKNGGKEEDLSMEEILQSIRRIIAEDGETPAEGAAEKKAPAITSDVPGSDVLELTEMLSEDGSVVSLKEEPKAEPKLPDAPPADVLSRIDQALEQPAAKPQPLVETPAPPPVAAAPKPAPAPVAAPAPAPAPKPAAAAGESLLSAQAAAAAVSSLNKLKTEEELPPVATTPSPVFRSGATVEDMVADMLKPMMKEWLDANLPSIVERIVEREVRRLTRP